MEISEHVWEAAFFLGDGEVKKESTQKKPEAIRGFARKGKEISQCPWWSRGVSRSLIFVTRKSLPASGMVI